MGGKHFRSLRREAAAALVGPEHHISSWLALHVFSPQLQDPLLYVISTGVTFIRRLYHTNHILAQTFVTAVSTHTGPAIGPAGALARYLNLIGWVLSTDGHLTLDGYLSVSLRSDSLRHIRRVLRQAWAYHIARQICHRKGVEPHPFDFSILSRALQSMSVTCLKQIAYNLTGGYQVGAVKALRSHAASELCTFCNQPDTHHHQQLHCPAFQATRDRHPQAVSYLERNAAKVWLPLPHSFPDIENLRQLLCHRGCDTGHTPICHNHNTLHFYTDGSADTPLHHETRRAAWSVVQFQPDDTTTPYIVIKIQHVAGHQSIARAELAAVTWIVQYVTDQQWSQHVTITTDSQYVINSIFQLTQPNCRPSWHRLANADLLQVLASRWHPNQFTVRKVKSHQDLHTLPSGSSLHDALGNDWADQAAVRARQTDHPVCNTISPS